MHRIMVAGIGTDVGKTIVSAILALLFQADYWKPIQCGCKETSDMATLKAWLDLSQHFVHAPAYSFHAPLSPHHAAVLENIEIQIDSILLPQTKRSLIIESVGGVLVPLTVKQLSMDLFASWNCLWIIVSRHYLGSINHTLLTIESLKQRQIPILGIIFNGDSNPHTEAAILEITQLPCLGQVFPEPYFNQYILARYVQQWQSLFSKLLP